MDHPDIERVNRTGYPQTVDRECANCTEQATHRYDDSWYCTDCYDNRLNEEEYEAEYKEE